MTKIKKLLVLICAAAPLAAFAVTSGESGQTNAATPKPPVDSDNLFANSTIATGKGVSITRSQLDDEIIRLKAVLAAQGRSPQPEEMAAMEDQVLDSLIGKQLLLAKATEADRLKGKEDFDKAIQKIKANAKITEEQYNQRLNQQLRLLNVTKEDWEKQSAEQATIPIVLTRELNINITDADVKKFYDENSSKFEQADMVKAAHILLMTTDPATRAELSEEKKAAKKKQIEDLLKRAKAGEDFGKLAKEYSEDPGSKDNGGEYTFPRGQMVPEFEAAAFSLGTNQVSDVITTQFGYHIIKLYEKIPAKKLALTEMVPGGAVTVAEYVKDTLTQQALQKQASEYILKLRKAAGVEILDPKLKASAEAREKNMDSLKDTDSPANNTLKVPGGPK
jgi:peptidyl-prolyl cis-trans isomerase C